MRTAYIFALLALTLLLTPHTASSSTLVITATSGTTTLTQNVTLTITP